ncbi:aspartate/glutamate racemase family protein [Nocardia sp. NPDC046763]|uniref:aspartate/glutamate racemase family protein n=1 Tax=Nocardia sp. NPDC046763 TaxID=3155256 RepID=UPI0033DE0CC0
MTSVAAPPRIGVIGGLGPLAGATFYQRLVELTPARDDRQHPEVVMISDPRIPSRLDHLRGEGPSPVPALQQVARRLEQQGCDIVVITSFTTHAYLREITDAIDVRVLDGLVALSQTLLSDRVLRPAVAMTTPARSLALIDTALRSSGLAPQYPDDATQDEIQATVESVKQGAPPDALAERLRVLFHREWTNGSDAVVVGCTDLSALRVRDIGTAYDAATVLAGATLREVGVL